MVASSRMNSESAALGSLAVRHFLHGASRRRGRCGIPPARKGSGRRWAKVGLPRGERLFPRKKLDESRSRFLKDHAHVVQSRNKAAPIGLPAAGGPMAKANYISTCLLKPSLKGELFGVVGEGDETRFVV